MTTLAEIDMQNALAIYALANGADLTGDNCWRLPSGNRSGYTDTLQILWTHESIPKPSAIELINTHDTLVNNEATRIINRDTTLASIKSVAQSAVGVALTDLTQAQIKALIAILLYRAGAVDVSNATVAPLNEWAR